MTADEIQDNNTQWHCELASALPDLQRLDIHFQDAEKGWYLPETLLDTEQFREAVRSHLPVDLYTPAHPGKRAPSGYSRQLFTEWLRTVLTEHAKILGWIPE